MATMESNRILFFLATGDLLQRRRCIKQLQLTAWKVRML